MLFGHEEKISAFKKLIANGNLGQSYLFFGDAQIGKAGFAKALAYFLEYGKFEITAQPLLDSRVFSPNENKVIGIDAALEIRRFLFMTPVHSSRRLAIVDEIETITPEAQGALLKIVEEPPSRACLIFIAHDVEFLFPPLLSRLIKVYFPRLSRKKVREILTDEYQVPAARAKILSEESFGRLGYALALWKGDKTGTDEPNLEKEIEGEILALRRNLPRNYGKIAILNNHLMLLRRYNLNTNLQRKAISYEISHA